MVNINLWLKVLIISMLGEDMELEVNIKVDKEELGRGINGTNKDVPREDVWQDANIKNEYEGSNFGRNFGVQ